MRTESSTRTFSRTRNALLKSTTVLFRYDDNRRRRDRAPSPQPLPPHPPPPEKRQKFHDAAAAAACCYCLFHRVFESFGGVFNIPFREGDPDVCRRHRRCRRRSRLWHGPLKICFLRLQRPSGKSERMTTQRSVEIYQAYIYIVYCIIKGIPALRACVRTSSENTRGNSARACFSRGRAPEF